MCTYSVSISDQKCELIMNKYRLNDILLISMIHKPIVSKSSLHATYDYSSKNQASLDNVYFTSFHLLVLRGNPLAPLP